MRATGVHTGLFFFLAAFWVIDGESPRSPLDFECGPTGCVKKADFRTCAPLLSSLGATDDPDPEMSGTIRNRMEILGIGGVQMWLEAGDGSKAANATGNSPVRELMIAELGQPMQRAALQSSRNRIATFVFAEPLPAGSDVTYAAQVDSFEGASAAKACVAFLSADAAISQERYGFLGGTTVTQARTAARFDGSSTPSRKGFRFELTNGEPGSDTVRWVESNLVSSDTGLSITGGDVRGEDGNVIPGTSASITDAGKKLVITGLRVTTGHTVTVWIDMNHEYSADTNLDVRAGYAAFEPAGR